MDDQQGDRNRLKVAKMLFFRRMFRVSYVNRITDEEALEGAGTTRSLVNKIRKRQATFFGHVMRKKRNGAFSNDREN